jgi:hypothetical protein
MGVNEIHVPRDQPPFEVPLQVEIERIPRPILKHLGKDHLLIRESAMHRRIPKHGDSRGKSVPSELLGVVGDGLLESSPRTGKADQHRTHSSAEEGDEFVE